ncbi:MAG: 3-phosphoserine/phosphohydroxythreonine transaminase [Blastocatellia bacterium]|nr:3-phosphoserine/phosphohydroxythreonine transaminase [Blastocatellia bacterium]
MSTPAVKRIFNFSAGPAVLPVPVLEQIRDEMLSLPGVGMSVLEISHRSKTFDDIIQTAEAKLRSLMGIPENYHVLFLQGGASLQFSMIPMNFLPAGGSADYILTGVWAEKAYKEAKRCGTINAAASTKEENFTRIPKQEELKLDPNAAYVHMTSNNTIYGTQWHNPTEPEVGNVPLVCDSSSDILSRPVDISKYAVIYAGAQKNIGPSGVTLVILRDDMLAKIPDGMHTMLDYRTHTKEKSLYNTPPTFGIYVIGLVAKYLESLGGLAAMEKHNQEKAAVLYDAIDASEFYRGTCQKESRSLMNICFRLPNEDLEKQLIKEATAAGFDGLKGHRSVGGLRASVYNAFPKEGVVALVEFMKEFERKNG